MNCFFLLSFESLFRIPKEDSLDRNLKYYYLKLSDQQDYTVAGRRRSEEAVTNTAAVSSCQVLLGLSCSDITLSQEGTAQAFLLLHLATNFWFLC